MLFLDQCPPSFVKFVEPHIGRLLSERRFIEGAKAPILKVPRLDKPVLPEATIWGIRER